MIDRRDLLQRAAMLLGGTLASGTVAGVLAGCTATPQPAGGVWRFFTPAEGATMTAMADQIIPRTDTQGAVDVGVPAFIDRLMADFYQDRERDVLRAGLARADADARARHDASFAALASDQQIALMQVYDREAFEANRQGANPPHFFRLMKELTTTGFFTSEYGATQFLRYDPVPGPLRADIPLSEVGRAWSS